MDYIFGDKDEEAPKPKKKEKQLRTEIILKQDTKKDKQLTPLQRFKLQAKKKINDEFYEPEQFKQIQSNEFMVEESVKQFSSVDPSLSINHLLGGQLSVSQKGLRFLDRKLIGDRLGDIENLVYTAQTAQKPSNYLKGVFQNIEPDNKYIKDGVSQTLNGVVTGINKSIQSPKNEKNKKISIQKRRLPKTKDDLKQLQKTDKYRLIKIKQGEVKNKVGNLRNQLQRQYFQNKNKIKFNVEDIVDTNYYSMQHPQTKKAQNLIHQLQQKRRNQHRRYKQHLNFQQAQKQRVQLIQHQYQQKFKQQRKQKMKKFFEQKMHQREEKKQQLKRKQQQFKQWIKMYQRQKPLEERLQQQMVMKHIIPQIQDRHKKLMKIKAERKPIDIQQINQHDHRYMDYKRDQLIRQKAQIQMKMENDHFQEQNVSRYYKGKYRYMALESMYEQKNQTDSKDVQRSKKQRQLAYSDQVKYYHQSMNKRKYQAMDDTRSLIRRVRNHNGSVSVNDGRLSRTIQAEKLPDQQHTRRHETLDPRAEGLKNLQYVKSHIRQKLMNGEEKKPKINFVEQKQKYSFLDQLRQKRKLNSLPHRQKGIINQENMKNSSLHSAKGKFSIHQLSTSNDFQTLKVKVDNLDQRIKRNEVKNKHVKGHYGTTDDQIQNEYLEAINVKLKLVQELK